MNRVLPSRRSILLYPLGVLLLCWVWFILSACLASGGPNGANLSKDFAHSYSGALLLQHGGNPYDYQQLWHTERIVLTQLHVSVEADTSAVRTGTSAIVLWAFEPLTAFPYTIAFALWTLIILVLLTLGCMSMLRYFGWERRVLPCLLILLTPQVTLSLYYGNTSGLVFAGFGLALPLLDRSPLAAGALLSLATLKPQVGLPVVLLLVLFHAAHRRSVLAGFLVALGGRQALSILLLGAQYQWWWLQGLAGFSHSLDVQSNLISLSGLYEHWTPQTMETALELLGLGIATVLTARTWYRLRHCLPLPIEATAPLWFIWLVATPYAHFVDEMMLAIPIAALIGPGGRGLTNGLPLAALYATLFSILLYSWAPSHVQVLALPLLGVAAALIINEWKTEGGRVFTLLLPRAFSRTHSMGDI